MTENQPMRTTGGANQSKGGNYENPGGNSTGSYATPSATSETNKPMNNGGGPEPHQGSNPGAQSDPGPKEVGFYDTRDNHVLGDDGVQAYAERPSPMRMASPSSSRRAKPEAFETREAVPSAQRSQTKARELVDA